MAKGRRTAWNVMKIVGLVGMLVGLIVVIVGVAIEVKAVAVAGGVTAFAGVGLRRLARLSW